MLPQYTTHSRPSTRLASSQAGWILLVTNIYTITLGVSIQHIVQPGQHIKVLEGNIINITFQLMYGFKDLMVRSHYFPDLWCDIILNKNIHAPLSNKTFNFHERRTLCEFCCVDRVCLPEAPLVCNDIQDSLHAFDEEGCSSLVDWDNSNLSFSSWRLGSVSLPSIGHSV